MWALTKYCAERTHFTPNIPLKILLSLLTAAVAVVTYSVVFAFGVVKLIAVPLYRGLRYGWANADDIALAGLKIAFVAATTAPDVDDDVVSTHRVEYTPAERDIFGNWHEESYHDTWN